MIDINSLEPDLPPLPEGEYWDLEVTRASMLGLDWLTLRLRKERRWWFDSTIEDYAVTSPFGPAWYRMRSGDLKAAISAAARRILENEQNRKMAETARRSVPRRGTWRLS